MGQCVALPVSLQGICPIETAFDEMGVRDQMVPRRILALNDPGTPSYDSAMRACWEALAAHAAAHAELVKACGADPIPTLRMIALSDQMALAAMLVACGLEDLERAVTVKPVTGTFKCGG